MSARRSLHELLVPNDSAWPIVQAWIQGAANTVEALPPDSDSRGRALEEVQVTTRSPIGAIVYETGGIFIDHGWLRILGSGHERIRRSLPEWNRGRSVSADGRSHGFLLVADDVVGGFYALNGGAFGPETGKIFYFAPDTLRWESMNNMGYSELLVWALGDKLSRFYASLGWDGWESEVSFMGGDSALSVYPFLWSKEAKDIARSSRKACPIEEVYELNVVDLPAQLRTGRL